MAVEGIATPPGSCELNKLLSRDWAAQIKPKGAGPSEWIYVRGADTIDVQVETSAVDSSDMESDGWESQMKTSRTLKIQINGKFARVGDSRELEPSQALLRKTGEALGAEGELDVRVWRTDGTNEGWETTATNVYSTPSGDAKSLRTFNSALQSVCAPSRIEPVKAGKTREASVYVDADGKPLPASKPASSVTPGASESH
ncbi:hypothetical protein QP222_05685 [Corynebacterium pyruviciproducens]|uniref:phage tail tube protein n=1 Tax=Corynebacterium pyruviciproducens TaxID=598660 RepID=UPI00254A3CBF|nr:hypothetical protein [Corynebacterium pyruviciproducens]MDK6565900.1 hypothetical protein [Corynebacterium pyruviciproducens]